MLTTRPLGQPQPLLLILTKRNSKKSLSIMRTGNLMSYEIYVREQCPAYLYDELSLISHL